MRLVGEMNADSALTDVLGHLRAEPSRTWSVIITLYGDVVAPRGGSLWLGTLLEVFAALGIGGNVVRTAMSRLAADGWLERNRVGRNSFYRLAPKGRTIFAEAARRIYAADAPDWDGSFHLALLPGRTGADLADCVALAPGVLLALSPAHLPAEAIRLRAVSDPEDAKRLAQQAWPLDRTAAGYRRFLAVFAPMQAALAQGGQLGELQALATRVLLIHEYRRVVLRDPLLPCSLLPQDWPGHSARRLCGELYQLLRPGSEAWLDAHALNEEGPLPPPDQGFADRFAAEGRAAAQHITKILD